MNIVAENETVIKTLTEKIENDEKTIRALEKRIALQDAILLENIELNNIICEQDKKISELIQHNNELALVCYDNFDMNGDPILVVIDIRNETTDAVYKMRRSHIYRIIYMDITEENGFKRGKSTTKTFESNEELEAKKYYMEHMHKHYMIEFQEINISITQTWDNDLR